MQRQSILFLIQSIIFLNRNEITEGVAGPNVRNARSGEFTSSVAILRFNNPPTDLRSDVLCTGTMITSDHVLTSEHCFANMGPLSLYVLAGSVDLRLSEPLGIAWWITHNMWANLNQLSYHFIDNDIAIVKLVEQVPDRVVPALLSPDGSSKLFGLDVSLVGWGRGENRVIPYILQVGQVRIISNADCESVVYRLIGKQLPVHERYLCSLAEPPSVVTDGDSGGAIFYGHFIVGINQGTVPPTNKIVDRRKANLHYSIDYYRIFIESNMII